MLLAGIDEEGATGMLGTLAGGGITIVEFDTGGGGGGRLLVTATGVLEDSGQTLVVV